MAVEEDQEKLIKSSHSRIHHHHHDAAARMPPKGRVAVSVGRQGAEDRQRFAVPVVYLNHPLFAELMQAAEQEYGFRQEGAIVIPCDVQHFLQVMDSIAGAATHHHQRRHHHHHQHRHHFPCFGA